MAARTVPSGRRRWLLRLAARSLRPLVLALRRRSPASSDRASRTGWTSSDGSITSPTATRSISRTAQKIRLVQIDTPEVYFTPECYGEQASAITKRLLPPGTLVKLYREPATDSIDQYGRLLRYVVRVRDGLNVNVQLVRVGAAAPYFYDARRGRFASLLERLALHGEERASRALGPLPRNPVRPGPRRRHGAVSNG